MSFEIHEKSIFTSQKFHITCNLTNTSPTDDFTVCKARDWRSQAKRSHLIFGRWWSDHVTKIKPCTHLSLRLVGCFWLIDISLL
jgi:hypothetical protein